MINLTWLFVIAGIGILVTILEKVFSKAGNETMSYIIGIASLIFGFLIIGKMLVSLINEIVTTFIFI